MEPTGKFTEITPAEVRRRMENKEPMTLIHLLTKDHFMKAHIPSAENACVFEVSFLDQIKAITEDQNAPIVLYGSSDRSRDAETAAEKLLRAGYRNIASLKGGIKAWRGSGYDLEGDAPEAPDEPTDLLRLQDGTYRVDPEESIIEWAGRNPGTRHTGTVAVSEGDIVLKDGIFSGRVDIDMTTIKNINLEGDPLQPVLISHLESDDFFFVKLFPTASYEIIEGRAVSEPFLSSPNVEIKGALSLRGIKADLGLTATVVPTGDGVLTANANVDFDRTRWNVIYGSTRFFEHLGMHLVFDTISVQLKITARRPAP